MGPPISHPVSRKGCKTRFGRRFEDDAMAAGSEPASRGGLKDVLWRAGRAQI